LFGRSGRQGDPGSYQTIVSLEDDIVSHTFKTLAKRMSAPFARSGHPLPGWLGAPLVGMAQRIAERRHASIRRELLRVDDQLQDLLAFTGRGE
jgi:preprotein translocase subunit SecA